VSFSSSARYTATVIPYGRIQPANQVGPQGAVGLHRQYPAVVIMGFARHRARTPLYIRSS